MLTKEIIEKGINDTLAEIKQVISAAGVEFDALQKSMDPLQKPEDQKQDDESVVDPSQAGQEPPMADPSGEPSSETPIEDENQPVGEEMEESLEDSIKQMSDEELDHLMQVVSSEKQSRSAMSSAGGSQMPPQAAAPQPNEFEKSIKAEFEKLSKSISEIKKEISEVKNSKLQKSIQKPAATNSVTSVEKNTGNETKKPERLNKSETIEFALGKIGKGVDSEMIAELNNARSDEDLHKLQDKMERKLGLQLPKA